MALVEQNSRKKVLFGEDNNSLVWLIIINAVVYVALLFIWVIYTFSYDSKPQMLQFYNEQILNWFTVPADLNVLSSRPWTILMYMFTNESVWGFVSTAFWLWAFGYILQDLIGNTKLIPIYLYGGVTGAIIFLLTANMIPQINIHIDSVSPLIGGGASVMAVVIAATALQPAYKIFPMLNGGIPVWILTILYVAISLTTAAVNPDGAAFVTANITGGIIGYLFIVQLRKGNDWGLWMNNFWQWLDKLFDPAKKQQNTFNKDRLFYKAERKPFEKKPHVTQQKLDEILDKINQKGYHLLTDEEKDFLKKASSQDL